MKAHPEMIRKYGSEKFILLMPVCTLKDQFFHDEPIYFNFELSFNIPKDKHDYSIFFMVLDSNKARIFSSESKIISSEKVQLIIEPDFLVRGSYSIHAFIHKPRTEQVDVAEDVCNFKVIDNGSGLLIHGDYDYGNLFVKYLEIFKCL